MEIIVMGKQCKLTYAELQIRGTSKHVSQIVVKESMKCHKKSIHFKVLVIWEFKMPKLRVI
jgi:hypothetical protein